MTFTVFKRIFGFFLQTGTVRDICCSPDGRWIALGFSSGLTSVLDIRGGLLRSHRRAHTSEIYQVTVSFKSMRRALAFWCVFRVPCVLWLSCGRVVVSRNLHFFVGQLCHSFSNRLRRFQILPS